MFEENENIFPAKPELIAPNLRNNRLRILLGIILVAFLVLNYFSDSYLLILELLLVLIIHEFGHYLMMRIFKAKSQGLFIMSALGRVTGSLRFSDSQRQQILINLMGPLPGVILGCGLLITLLYLEPNVHLIELALLFIGINVLNLLPIDPFDGGRIVENLFFSDNDHPRMVFTLISSLLVIGTGVYFSFIPLIIFGFLMGLKVRSYQKSKVLHDCLDENNIDYRKEYKDLTNREYWKIRSIFLTNNPKLKEMIPSGYTLWENERLLMEQVRQVLRIQVKPDLSVFAKVSIVLFIIILIGMPLYLIWFNYELIEWYIAHAGF